MRAQEQAGFALLRKVYRHDGTGRGCNYKGCSIKDSALKVCECKALYHIHCHQLACNDNSFSKYPMCFHCLDYNNDLDILLQSAKENNAECSYSVYYDSTCGENELMVQCENVGCENWLHPTCNNVFQWEDGERKENICFFHALEAKKQKQCKGVANALYEFNCGHDSKKIKKVRYQICILYFYICLDDIMLLTLYSVFSGIHQVLSTGIKFVLLWFL